MKKTLLIRLLIPLCVFFCTTKAISRQWEPQITVLCENGHSYHPQKLSDDGKWISNLNVKAPATCLKDKIDLLNYCKAVYPDRDITNIVESSHYQKVGNWCSLNAANVNKCKGTTRWVKPFRCLEGPFQSDALLVPEGCLFDHIHNASRCWPFMKWNQTGGVACKERNMQIRSFAMLLPCGISLFSGVEFVCCPKTLKVTPRVKKTDLPITFDENQKHFGDAITHDNKKENYEDIDEDDDDDDDDEDETEANDYEEDYESDEKNDEIDSSAQTTVGFQSTSSISKFGAETTTEAQELEKTGISDPYFTEFNPKLEHQNFKDAQQRLEENHREKVTKVMKDWSDLEEKYQDMRSSNPVDAQSFKKKMTQRFQLSVQTLEDEENAAKHQLTAMHQQRVLERINRRKKEAMKCYTQALTKTNPDPQTVEKCLQKLLRTLHKDRSHALAHYRHILSSQKNGVEAAAPERALTLSRLVDIDKAVNQSMAMLKRFPSLSHKLTQIMTDYVQALRSKDETPGLVLAPNKEAEESILDKYKSEVMQNLAEKERQHFVDKKKLKARYQEHKKIINEKNNIESGTVLTETLYQTTTPLENIKASDETETINTSTQSTSDLAVKKVIEDVATVLTYEVPEPKVQHVMGNNFGHGESEFKTKSGKSEINIFFITGISALLIGTLFIVIRMKYNCAPRGFVEIDQQKVVTASPEEKHVTIMQVNGYENPTYKYFEIKE